MTTITNNKQCGICADCVPQINGGSGFNNCAEAHAAQMAEDKVMDNKLTGLGANHPANGPLTTERLGHVRDVLHRNLKYSNGGSMDYIIADAVKAIDELLAGRKAEPVAYIGINMLKDMRDECRQSGRVWINDTGLGDCIPLYTAPPVPVITDELIDRIVVPLSSDGLDEEKHHCEWHLYHDRERIRKTLREYFLAPTTPDGYALVPLKPTKEMLLASEDERGADWQYSVDIWDSMCRAAMFNGGKS